MLTQLWTVLRVMLTRAILHTHTPADQVWIRRVLSEGVYRGEGPLEAYGNRLHRARDAEFGAASPRHILQDRNPARCQGSNAGAENDSHILTANVSTTTPQSKLTSERGYLRPEPPVRRQ